LIQTMTEDSAPEIKALVLDILSELA